jgi:gas vesicle protein
MSTKRSGLFIGGLLVGSAIGAVTGLLMAPRTGKETRQILKKSADALPELAEIYRLACSCRPIDFLKVQCEIGTKL